MTPVQEALAKLRAVFPAPIVIQPKRPGFGKQAAELMRGCRAIRQGDEVYCPVAGCGLRWSLSEDRPECPCG